MVRLSHSTLNMKGKNDMARKTELLYMKLCHQLMSDYEDKPYYSPLPGERELCEIYKVSRPTVRKALEVLESEGCIARFAGKGAFFIGNKQEEESKDENPASTNIAFYNQVRLRGDYTRSKVLSQKIELADKEVAEALQIKQGDRVFYLERLRYINEELWSISDAYIAYEKCPELMEYDFTERSLHNTLSNYGHVPLRAKRHLTIRKADDYESFNLGLEKDAPVCVAKAVTTDMTGKPLEYSVSRSDAYHMSIELVQQNKIKADETASYTNIM